MAISGLKIGLESKSWSIRWFGVAISGVVFPISGLSVVISGLVVVLCFLVVVY